MKRREFTLTTSAALAATSVLGMSASAQTRKPAPGTEYQVLDTRAPVEAPAGKIEVVEFFWYNCQHCAAFEPLLAPWAKKVPKDVVFRRVPVAFNDSFAPQQRLYYALEALGQVDALHGKVFTAIHVERINLAKGEAIVEWVGRQGLDKAKFLEQYNSFSVASKATRATQLHNAYKIEGVPALGVAGRFLTDGPMAGSMERALQVVESLVADIRSGK
jgi:thiol:disulfide interchange protein DsbA